MLPVEFGVGPAVVCDGVEERPFEKPERPVLGCAEPRAGVDHLFENRLQAYGASDRAKDAADRALLLAQVLELTSELRAIGGYACHSSSLDRTEPSQPPHGRRELETPT